MVPPASHRFSLLDRRAAPCVPVEHVLIRADAGRAHPRPCASGCGLQPVDMGTRSDCRQIVRVRSVEHVLRGDLRDLGPAQHTMVVIPIRCWRGVPPPDKLGSCKLRIPRQRLGRSPPPVDEFVTHGGIIGRNVLRLDRSPLPTTSHSLGRFHQPRISSPIRGRAESGSSADSVRSGREACSPHRARRVRF